jgi:hypothetical protein
MYASNLRASSAFPPFAAVSRNDETAYDALRQATLGAWAAHSKLCAAASQIGFHKALHKFPANGALHKELLVPVSYHFDSPYGIALNALESRHMTFAAAAQAVACLSLVVDYYGRADALAARVWHEGLQRVRGPAALWFEDLLAPAPRYVRDVRAHVGNALAIVRQLVGCPRTWQLIVQAARDHVRDIAPGARGAP